MKKSDIFTYSGSLFGGIFTAIQTNEIFQYISLGLTILSTLVAIAFTIYKWYKKANEDGKITPEECEELKDELEDVLKDKDKKDEE